MAEIKDIQLRVKEFCRKNNMESPPEHRVLDAMSELGEVAKEILIMGDYGKKPLEFRNEMKSEIGDLFYSLVTIANCFGISLEEALESVLKKYDARLKKGSAGQERME